MSSVSGASGRDGKDETIRQQREDHQEKESELIKRHHKSIRNMSEAHQSEVEKLKDSYKSQIRSLKEQHRNSVTHRERDYQNEIRQLNKLQRQRLSHEMRESQDKLEAQKKAVLAEKNLAVRGQEQKGNVSLMEAKNTIQNQQNDFDSKIGKLRESQRTAIDQQKKSLNEHHFDQMDALRNDRDVKVNSLQAKLSNDRSSYRNQLKNEGQRHWNNLDSLSKKSMGMVRREREGQQQSNEILREGFKDSLFDVKHKYNRALASRSEDQDQAFRNFKDSVDGRVNNQVQNLEREVSDLKHANVLERTRVRNEASREVDNIRNAFTENIEILDAQRKENLENANSSNSRDIHKIRSEMNQLMKQSNINSARRRNSQDQKSKEAFTNIRTDYNARLGQEKETAEMRIDSIQENYNVKAEKTSRYFNDRLEAMKESHEKEVADLRLRVNQQKNEEVNRIREQMMKNEVRHSKMESSQARNFENQMGKKNDDSLRAKVLSDQRSKSKISGLQRSHTNQMDSVKLQFNQKLEDLKGQQREEISRVNQKNQEQMDSLLNSLKKS